MLKTKAKSLILPVFILAFAVNPPASSSEIGELQKAWWNWFLSDPAIPFDPTGDACDLNQPADDIWYLAGTFGPRYQVTQVTRTCQSVPSDRRIFFPIVNGVATNQQGTFDSTEEEKREALNETFSGIPNGNPNIRIPTAPCVLTASLDGKPIVFGSGEESNGNAIVREQSGTFGLIDNVFGAISDEEAVSDGFWVLLPGLSKGEHEVRFQGTLCYSITPKGMRNKKFNIPIVQDGFFPSGAPPETGRVLKKGDTSFGLDVTYTLIVVDE